MCCSKCESGHDVISLGDDCMREAQYGIDNISQFIVNGKSFTACANTVKELPNGYYRLYTDRNNNVVFELQYPKLNKLVVLESCDIHQIIIKDIQTFWASREKYAKRNKVYKRNLLLYSKPGIGKTSLINILVKDLIDNQNGLVISLGSSYEIELFTNAMNVLRTIMPDKPVIVIIEDVDNFAGSHSIDRQLETELLNILDGIYQYDNLVILATTNYPEYLTERYICRPSRFNRRFEFPLPNVEVRREFLIKTNLKEDIESIDLDKWLRRTEGYTIDFLKELSDAVFISGRDEEEVFDEIDNMRGVSVLKNTSNEKIGLIK